MTHINPPREEPRLVVRGLLGVDDLRGFGGTQLQKDTLSLVLFVLATIMFQKL